MLLTDGLERDELVGTRIDKEDVDAPGLLLHDLDQAVEVGETRCVATDASCAGANLRDGLVELGLAAAGDEDARSFGGEQSRRREANAGGPPVITATFPSSFLLIVPAPANSPLTHGPKLLASRG